MEDPTTHYMEATDRMRQRAERAEDELEAVRNQYEPHVRILTDYARDLEAERDRLRTVVEAAIGTIERAQFTGSSCDVCTETYRVLHDESIAPEPEQLDGSGDMGGAERDLTDYRDIWPLINQLADDVTGVDGNVIRGWLDTTVREAIFGGTDG